MKTIGNDLILGKVGGGRHKLKLSADERSTHLYVCGSTGTGKSKFLENLICQDIEQWSITGCGLLLIDPHGSLYDSVVKWVADNELKRPLVLIDLSEPDWVIGYNVLRKRAYSKGQDESVVIQDFIRAMSYVWGVSGTQDTPLFARWASNILRTLYNREVSLLESEYLTSLENSSIKHWLVKGLDDRPNLRAIKNDWNLASELNFRDVNNEISSTINRLRPFLSVDRMRSMFGQVANSFDMDEAIEQGAIVLVNCSTKGNVIGQQDASLFSTLLLSDLWDSIRARGKSNAHKAFYVYLDEFQRFITPSMAENLNESRGYGLHMTMAHQYPEQIKHQSDSGQYVIDSIINNARNKAVFEVGLTNLEQLAKTLFFGTLDVDEVKHEMYSTKVMEYIEEVKTARSRSSSSSHGYGMNERLAENYSVDSEGVPLTSMTGFASSSGSTDFNSDTTSESISEIPVLVPKLGKEISHIQYRSLEEQLFRSMQRLFQQDQRSFVVRLNGMKAPASVETPFVSDPLVGEERVKRFKEAILKECKFAFTREEAEQNLLQRENRLSELARESSIDEEPLTAKRKI